ncbi:gp53-like domain-containing protein [Brucella sp. 22210]|uniref:gp53-like domain-containing protein n=1 Tax=Brucella sp. 22210 TaxID=3453892 RepID=UPI003F84B40E
MAIIPIRDIPTTISSPTGSDFLVIDNGVSMGKASLNSVVDARAPTLITNAINALGLGTASQQNVEAFATAAQGTKADSAVQPAITIAAGTGLTGGGTLAANRTIALSSTSIASLALADTSVQPGRLVSAGTGLTGGGSLAADRTLALSAASIASLAKADTAIQAPGGSAGQVLTKNSGTDGDVSWQSVAAATAVSYAPQTLTGPQQTQARQNISAQEAGVNLEALRAASGAAANQLAYMTSGTAAAFTPLTAFARTVIDDSSGAAMFTTMGATQSLGGGSGYTKLPNGALRQWGSAVVTTSAGGYVAIVFPTSFTNTNWAATFSNGERTSNPQMLILQNRDALSSSQLDVQCINSSTGAAVVGLVRINWQAEGN